MVEFSTPTDFCSPLGEPINLTSFLQYAVIVCWLLVILVVCHSSKFLYCLKTAACYCFDPDVNGIKYVFLPPFCKLCALTSDKETTQRLKLQSKDCHCLERKRIKSTLNGLKKIPDAEKPWTYFLGILAGMSVSCSRFCCNVLGMYFDGLGVGYTYCEINSQFIPACPFRVWSLELCRQNIHGWQVICFCFLWACYFTIQLVL